MVRLTEMVRQKDTSAIVFDWLNGDVRTLRRDYESVRAKPVPAEAEWIDAGGVRVLHFPAGAGGTSPPHSASASLGGPLPAGERSSEALRLAPSSPQRGEGGANAPDEGGKAIVKPRLRTTAIVYFHGGGFIVGSPLTHADIATELIRHTGLPLYSVDYRLAPDHPAPAPAADGISVIRHLLGEGFNHILLCGDSAGGAIALSVEATLPVELRHHIIGVASFYGAHGLLDTNSLIEKGNREDGTDRACVARYFLAAGGNAYSIEALARPSPVPVYLIAADDDPLRDDTVILAKAMEVHGRVVTLDTVAGENHGFLHQPHYARAEAALGRFAIWLGALSNK
ncbi:alpha/beta hydrolase fold domain-containing protein [Rhizobium sp. TH2]|uniref:alpha/beta hydrolase n=1 Tax=Rhizobium sp. TH2 TaxID=2775403 RepID=UPI0021575D3E|nr:alpha/beta hydrolase [Rhizobium sp. TH2]UVC09269.1 alpha/beta hydrolase fold domain-containing protein [Rhizobium sp. TH2]